MNSSKIIRRFDEFGKITIPKEIRRSLKIKEYQRVEIITDKEGRIILVKCDDPEGGN